ncbi:1831_t:CDS:1, partial [Ambispora gerdemannii]
MTKEIISLKLKRKVEDDHLRLHDIDRIEEILSPFFKVAPTLHSTVSVRFLFDESTSNNNDTDCIENKDNGIIDAKIYQIGELQKLVKEFLESNYDYAQIISTEPNQINLTIRRNKKFCQEENNKVDDDRSTCNQVQVRDANAQSKHVIININDKSDDTFDEIYESGVSG